MQVRTSSAIRFTICVVMIFDLSISFENDLLMLSSTSGIAAYALIASISVRAESTQKRCTCSSEVKCGFPIIGCDVDWTCVPEKRPYDMAFSPTSYHGH